LERFLLLAQRVVNSKAHRGRIISRIAAHQQDNRMGRDRFAPADGVALFIGPRFDVHLLGSCADKCRDSLANGRLEFFEPGPLGKDRHVAI